MDGSGWMLRTEISTGGGVIAKSVQLKLVCLSVCLYQLELVLLAWLVRWMDGEERIGIRQVNQDDEREEGSMLAQPGLKSSRLEHLMCAFVN